MKEPGGRRGTWGVPQGARVLPDALPFVDRLRSSVSPSHQLQPVTQTRRDPRDGSPSSTETGTGFTGLWRSVGSAVPRSRAAHLGGVRVGVRGGAMAGVRFRVTVKASGQPVRRDYV